MKSSGRPRQNMNRRLATTPTGGGAQGPFVVRDLAQVAREDLMCVMIRRREFLGMGALAVGSVPRLVRAADALASHVAMPQDWATPPEYFDREITPTRVFF